MLLTPEKIARIEAYFQKNFECQGEIGASVCIWENGQEVVSLAGGFCDKQKTRPWTAETPVLTWSCTKALASACVLHAMERRGVALETRVSKVWPEFAQTGKGGITIAQLLSHQAGLAALDRKVSVFDHDAVVCALELQSPNWEPGSAHGYHPRTFGYLLDELLRRLEPGTTLGQYWQTHFAAPMGLDFWIGLPEAKLASVADMIPPNLFSSLQDKEFFFALARKETLTARAFKSPDGLFSPSSMNTAPARLASFPAFGGIGTARALAKFYAMLATGGEMEGVRYFNSIEPMTRVLTDGSDLILLQPSAFSAGFLHAPIFGPSPMAFGQPGAGGGNAFADPENNIAFAYVMNKMEYGLLPNEKSRGIVEIIYSH